MNKKNFLQEIYRMWLFLPLPLKIVTGVIAGGLVWFIFKKVASIFKTKNPPPVVLTGPKNGVPDGWTPSADVQRAYELMTGPLSGVFEGDSRDDLFMSWNSAVYTDDMLKLISDEWSRQHSAEYPGHDTLVKFIEWGTETRARNGILDRLRNMGLE